MPSAVKAERSTIWIGVCAVMIVVDALEVVYGNASEWDEQGFMLGGEKRGRVGHKGFCA